MVDYEKLYFKLFNEITKTIESLEKAREETFEIFVESNPTKDQARKFVENTNPKKCNSYILK